MSPRPDDNDGRNGRDGSNVHDDHIRDLLGVYALHALDADETAAVEAHLAGCAPCRMELEQHLDVAAGLGSMDLEPVREGFVDDLLVAIRQEQPGSTLAESPSAGAAAGKPGSAAPSAPVIDLSASRGARHLRERPARRWRTAMVAAGVTAAAAIPVTSWLSSSTPTLAALADRTAKAEGTRTYDLTGADGTAIATVIVGRDGLGYVRSTDLKALPADRTYQLWAVTSDAADAAPVSAGLLGRDPKLVAFTVATDAKAFAISVEPTTGSTGPTSAPVAAGNLQ